MKLLKKFTLVILISLINFINTNASENLFEKAKKNFEKKDYDKSKFLFQRNIVFNPKNAESYLYLAKIFKTEENQEEEEKNLDTTLLLEPDNEEAIYPDYIKMCEGFGVKARRIIKREDLHDGIREMLEADEPFLLEVIVPYTEHVLPMIPQGKSAKEMLID